MTTDILTALSAHNWLLLTILLSGLLLQIAHLPAINMWIGQRSKYVQPLWPLLCALLATVSTAGAT